MAFAFYAGCNLILAIAAAALCAYIAPAAAGSGIPEVKAYLNGVDAPSILAPSTLFVKVRHKLFPHSYAKIFGHMLLTETCTVPSVLMILKLFGILNIHDIIS